VTPAVIDTDPGIDDALALLFAWGSPELTVEALTTVAGNAPLAEATLNAWRVLDLCRPTPTPVIAGGAGAETNAGWPRAIPPVGASAARSNRGLHT